MIYLIKNKPYIKLPSYYKEVNVSKTANNISVVPKDSKDSTLSIYDVNSKEVVEISTEEYLKSKYTQKNNKYNDVEE